MENPTGISHDPKHILRRENYPLKLTDLDTGAEYEYARVVEEPPFYMVYVDNFEFEDGPMPLIELTRIDRAEIEWMGEIDTESGEVRWRDE